MKIPRNKESLNYFTKQMEEFKLVYHPDGYLIRRWIEKAGWLKKPRKVKYLNNNGYVALQSKVNGKYQRCKVHLIIWTYFNGDIPDNMEINHKNGKKSDNHIENYELITSQENVIHSRAFSLQKDKLTLQDSVEIRKLLDEGKLYQREIAEMFNISDVLVCNIKTGKRWNKEKYAKYLN